jgi:hypothetical protein
MKRLLLLLSFSGILFVEANGQTVTWKGRDFELKNVTASLVQLNGEDVLKLERDLSALPFDENNLSATVDEPTYAKLKDSSFRNGTIEAKVLSRIQQPSPFEAARGFIGVAFRIAANDSAFESIYLRPTNGRSENQFVRNHTVQYYSYPDFKFDRLRRESPGVYETYADVGLDEWITIRIEVEDAKVSLFINNQESPNFIVNGLKGKNQVGAIGLWVDIGTEGYFKDLRISPK